MQHTYKMRITEIKNKESPPLSLLFSKVHLVLVWIRKSKQTDLSYCIPSLSSPCSKTWLLRCKTSHVPHLMPCLPKATWEVELPPNSLVVLTRKFVTHTELLVPRKQVGSLFAHSILSLKYFLSTPLLLTPPLHHRIAAYITHHPPFLISCSILFILPKARSSSLPNQPSGCSVPPQVPPIYLMLIFVLTWGFFLLDQKL